MKDAFKVPGLLAAAFTLLFVIGIGWVLNLEALMDATATGEIIARVFGLFVAPAGALMGYFL